MRTENGDLPRVEEGNTGSTPVYSTHFVFLIVSGKLYHCDRVKAGSDSPGIR